MSCSGDSLTKARQGIQDLIGRLGPNEGLGMLVVEPQILSDRAFQFAGAPMTAAPDLFEGQRGKPALNQIDPRAAGGREVDMKPGPFRKPASDRRGLVRAVVVQDQMHVELPGHVGFDGVEKRAELHGAMAAVTLPDDLPAGDVEGRKQRGRSPSSTS